MIARGTIESTHPYAIALVVRRVRDVGMSLQPTPGDPEHFDQRRTDEHRRFGESLVVDETLAPMLVPACAATVRAAAGADPLGALETIADELERQARSSVDDELAVLVRRRVLSDRQAQTRRLLMAFEEPPQGPTFRRSLQAFRRAARPDEARSPEGRGRRPGAEGEKAAARREDLLGRYRQSSMVRQTSLVALRSDDVRDFVAAHAARHGVSRRTAERDWLSTRAWLHERGQLPIIGELDARSADVLRRRLDSLASL